MTQGEYLRSFRKRFGYTQGEVAKIIGVSYVTYSNMETNRQSISVDRLIKLSSLFSFQITDFIDSVYDIKIKALTPEQIKINKLYEKRAKIDFEIKRLEGK